MWQLLAGATMISFSPVLVKLAHVGPTTSAFYRVFFGGLMLAALARFKREPMWRGARVFGMASVCGVLFAVDLAMWHRSVHYVGPGLSTILTNFQVFFLAIYGVAVLGERLSWQLAAAIPLSLLGLFLLVGLEWPTMDAMRRAGVAYGLLAALAYASYLVTLRKTQPAGASTSPLTHMGVISLTAALFCAVEVVGLGESFRIPDGQSWAALTIYGLCGQVIGWVLIARGLPKVEASRAGLILLLQPALAFVWDVVFFSRSASPREVTGAILAVGAIYFGAVGRRPRSVRPEK